MNTIKLKTIIIPLLILMCALSFSNSYGQSIFNEGHFWFRYNLNLKITKTIFTPYLFIGTRYNFSKTQLVNGIYETRNTENAYLQELSIGSAFNFIENKLINFTGILGYTPFFYYADNVGGAFYVRHNLELQLRVSFKLKGLLLWYRNFTANSFQGTNGSGAALTNDIINRNQLGIMVPLAKWFAMSLDDEVFLRLNPKTYTGESVYLQNITTLSFIFIVPKGFRFELKYSYAHVMPVNTLAIHNHYISLWIYHNIKI